MHRDRRPRRGPRLDPELTADVREHLARLEQALADLASGEGAPPGFDPERFIAPGVPRVRPLLVVLSARAAAADQEGFEASPEATEHLAVAAELLHLAIALHDAALGRQGGRRRRAARRILSRGASLLGGNHLTLRALELARHAPAPETMGDVLDAMREISDSHALAQGLGGRLPNPEESIDLAHGRTAAVFAFACRAGARLGGAERRQVHTLGRFGRHAGVAWHLLDDLAPFHLDEDERDRALEERLARGLPNFAVSVAAEREPALAEVWQHVANEPDPVELRALADAVSASGAVAESRRRVVREAWAARRALRPLPQSHARDSLDRFAAGLAL